MDYGGGFSTDTGPLGLLEVQQRKPDEQAAPWRHASAGQSAGSNCCVLSMSIRGSPAMARDSSRRWLSRFEYQRDSTVTRFFRSAIDRGTNGIVQRLDEDGNPVDEFGVRVNEPTINRFTVAVETQRVLDQRTHTIVFARYSYEDVRLFNLAESVD